MSLYDKLPSIDTSKIKTITSDFSTGRDTLLKAVSGTAVSAADALTSFRSSITNSINSTLSALTGNLISISDLNSFIDISGGKISLNENALMNKIKDVTGLNISSTDNILSQVKDQIYSTINQQSNGALGKLIDKDGNVKLLDSLMSGDEYYKLSTIVDRYLDDQGKTRTEFSYNDYKTNRTVVTSLIRQAALAGNYIDVRSLYDSGSAEDKVAMATTLAESLSSVGLNGDFRTAAVITELITAERARSVVPELITLLFRNYRIPSYITLKEYDAEASRLIDFADAFKPGWGKTNYHGKDAELLTMWMETSSGFYSLFSRSRKYASLAATGKNYTTTTTMAGLKKLYPDLPTVSLG